MKSEIDLKNNGIVILENIPAGTEVGIDYHTWYTGPTFRGIANIPPGFHFIFFNSIDKYDEKAPRCGFFVYIKGGDIVVKIYDCDNEKLRDDDHTDTQIQQYIDDMETVGKYLAPYPIKECSKWFPLTSYVTHDLMNRVQPKCGIIDYLTVVPVETAGKQNKSVREIDSRIPERIDENTILRFSRLKCDLPTTLSPQKISQLNLDSTFYLEELITRLLNIEEDLLGELQLAFITFLIGQVYDAFDHWKLLITMMTSCFDALSTRSSLFLKFVDIVGDQMDEIPEDYFVDITAQHNFLVKTFQSFFQNFEYPEGISGDLMKKVSLLKHKLTTQFQWEFDDENEENMPVVVQL